jgi:hypothetical protein
MLEMATVGDGAMRFQTVGNDVHDGDALFRDLGQ